MKLGQLTVKTNHLIAHHVYKMEMQGELVSNMTDPGQFLHIKVAAGIEPTLRRPISICDVDLSSQTATIIYRVEGKGTQKLAEKMTGSSVDVLGPLGSGFPIVENHQRILLVGGGVGVPPLYYLAKKLIENGHTVSTILGFRSEKDVFLFNEFQKLGKTLVTTEDGSFGTKGYVTDVLSEVTFDTFYSCGPMPMLKALSDTISLPGYISLEERLGCGVGACLACVCDLANPLDDDRGYRKICTDGPVFKSGEVLLT